MVCVAVLTGLVHVVNPFDQVAAQTVESAKPDAPSFVAEWRQLRIKEELPSVTNHTVTLDPIRHRLLVIGGFGISLGDTGALDFAPYQEGREE